MPFIDGGCPAPGAPPRPYTQLDAALAYLHANAGKVSPVTLDIGANDLLVDFNPSTCTVNSSFDNDLKTLDTNLKLIILPQLHNALLVKGRVTGDLVMTNYYDPFQNFCSNSVPFVQTVNQHLTLM